jgi:hypothetical protein
MNAGFGATGAGISPAISVHWIQLSLLFDSILSFTCVIFLLSWTFFTSDVGIASCWISIASSITISSVCSSSPVGCGSISNHVMKNFLLRYKKIF